MLVKRIFECKKVWEKLFYSCVLTYDYINKIIFIKTIINIILLWIVTGLFEPGKSVFKGSRF